jgi:lipopolysaccharide/colanic/teichoic acid biosynthesis glycosyltransferase
VKRSHRVYDAIKRAIDIVVSAVALVVLSPVLLLTAIAVRVKLGSPVLFRQQRPGRGGRLFTINKFRTMLAAPQSTSDVSAVSTDAERLTGFGRFLRASSLDELPELLNVLTGDMSLVGPRPLLTEYLGRYNERQARRHEVRPGITGWAQVNGRNAVSWEERFEMDVYYVDHRSLLLDARVVAKTFSAVFGRRGISAQGHATMEPFDPNARTDDPKETS